MATETFTRSLWYALTPPAAPIPPLQDHIETDVLVIGGGFLGLSTSLHMAEAGLKVACLEAEQVGFGASGRNTGFVVPSLKTMINGEQVGRALGPRHAERLFDLVGRSGEILFHTVSRLGISCSAEQTGWLAPAHTADMAAILSKRQQEAARRGRPTRFLSAAETTAAFGAPGYHGALFEPTGGQINPLAYVQGLARAAIAAGARIYAGSGVLELTPDKDRWRARTPQAEVTAARVLLTTNALVGSLWPAMAESIVPARVFQIATEILDPALQQRFLPGRSPAADTRRHTFAVRWSPDGRLVTGGLVTPGPDATGRAARFFARRLQRLLPGLGPVKADHVWNGVIAVTLDSMPRFTRLAPGVDAMIGCNGRGVALTTALGRQAASLYAGETGVDDFVLPHRAPTPVPGRTMARIGPALWLPWSSFQDWRDTRV